MRFDDPSLSPAERRLRARKAGLLGASRRDMSTFAASGRDAFEEKFCDTVRAADPTLTDEDEIKRRAARLYKAHFLSMAIASAAVRRARRALAEPTTGGTFA
jgi:hypothetical protein